MSTPILDKFCSFSLTEEEYVAGSIFTLPQLQCLQNSLSEAAHARLALNYDPLNPGDFLQQEAYLKGKIELLDYLIENSRAVEANVVESARQQSQFE